MKLLDVVLEKITGAFEGGSYDNVSGNFDGMGLSAGVLQWCFGQGSLQNKILKPYIQRHGSIDKLGIFPITGMDKCALMSDGQAIAFAKNNMNTTKGIFKKTYSVKPEWRIAWKKFLLRPEVIQLQKEACTNIADQAKDMARMWGMNSPVAFYWFFDLLTQNGSLKGLQKPTYDIAEAKRVINTISGGCKKEWLKIDLNTLSHDQIVLLIASHRRAAMSRSQYINDVFSRKGTIALGRGIVHGDFFDFNSTYSIELSDKIF